MPPVRQSRSYSEIVSANREHMRRRRNNLRSMEHPSNTQSQLLLERPTVELNAG